MMESWDMLSDQERTRWLSTKIMGWPWFDSWEAYVASLNIGNGPVPEVVPIGAWPDTVHWPGKGEQSYAQVFGELDAEGLSRPFCPLASMISTWELLTTLKAEHPDLFCRVAMALFPAFSQRNGQASLLIKILNWTSADICRKIYEAYEDQQEATTPMRIIKANEQLAAINEIAQLSQDLGMYS